MSSSLFHRSGRFLVRYTRAALDCLYLLTVGLAKRENRAFLAAIREHCRSVGSGPVAPPSRPPGIPSVPAHELGPETCSIVVLAEASVPGNVTAQELIVLNRLVRQRAPRGCFEIGTFDGRTTLNLVANSPATCRVYTLDLPAVAADQTHFQLDDDDRNLVLRHQPGSRFHGTPYADRITQLFGDSARFDFSEYAGTCDFVFVDGAHGYDYVRHDSLTALRLLPDGKGTIVWHDFLSPHYDGVTRALADLQTELPAFRQLRHVRDTMLAVLTLP